MREDGRSVWDTTAVPEGTYQVRGVVSDQPGNPVGGQRGCRLGGGRLAGRPHAARIAVEREGDGSWRVHVLDAASPGGRLEVLEEGRVRYAAAPDDGVADSADETYRLSPAAGVEGRVLRVTDAAGNAVERPLSGL